MNFFDKLVTKVNKSVELGFVEVSVDDTVFNRQLLNCLEKNGYIRGYKIEKATKGLRLLLKYASGRPVFTKILRISKPSRKIYSKMFVKEHLAGGYSYILSTRKGLSVESANFFVKKHRGKKQKPAGGEILLKIV